MGLNCGDSNIPTGVTDKQTMCLIPKPYFWNYIYLFQMYLFRQNFMTSVMIYDVDMVLNLPFWILMFHVLPLTGFTFLSIFQLLKCLVM